MSGKTKKQKERAAKTKKREEEYQKHLDNIVKRVNHTKEKKFRKPIETEVKLPPEVISADLSGIVATGVPSKPIVATIKADQEDAELGNNAEPVMPQEVPDRDPLTEAVTEASEKGEPGILPFDPMSVVANMLKKTEK